jgi:hypothetical protein
MPAGEGRVPASAGQALRDDSALPGVYISQGLDFI